MPDVPLWVSVDQEGGRVARLKAPFTEWPPMATLGRSGRRGLAERFARALAAELKAVGITLDYAPVLDIHTNPKNPVIGDRALADKADDVARLGAAIIRTLQAEGIAACGKHFPGHGDTSVDSHLELPLVEHPPNGCARSSSCRSGRPIEAGVATIMTAHVLVPALDEQRPATLSRRIVTGLLREELGYDGVILSDDLEMKAIASEYAVPEAAVLAIEAGLRRRADLQRRHDTQAAALEALVHAVEDGRLPYGRVEDALKRQRRAKERFLGRRRRPPGRSRLAAAPAGARARRASRDCRRDGAVLVMREAARARSRAIASRSWRPRARSSAKSSTGRRARSAGSGSSRCTTTRCSRGSDIWRVRRSSVRAAIRARVARPVDCRRHRRPRRIRQRPGAAAARPRRGPAARESRSSATAISTAMLTFLTIAMRHGRVSRSDAGRTARAGARRLRRASFLKALCAARADGRAGAARARIIAPGEARGVLLGGTVTQLLASLATPFAFDSAGGLRPVPRGSGGAAVPARSDGHAAAADRAARTRARRS